MADFTNTKPVIGDVFPVGLTESPWTRTEPLITPEKLKIKHLFGIPLVSGMKDPISGRAQVMTDEMLADYIDTAVGLAELETGLTIFPARFEHKKAWDRQDYDSFGYFVMPVRPIAAVESIKVNLSSNDDIYDVPLQWVEVGQMQWGQINIIPLTIAMNSGNPTAIPTTAGGALLLSIFQGKSQWVSSFWKITYIAGFPDAMLPKVVNDLIGTIAAMEVLSQLASTYGKSSGSSLSIDGMSQSMSTPGPEIFTKRMTDLEAKRTMLIGKLKAAFHLKFFSNNV